VSHGATFRRSSGRGRGDEKTSDADDPRPTSQAHADGPRPPADFAAPAARSIANLTGRLLRGLSRVLTRCTSGRAPSRCPRRPRRSRRERGIGTGPDQCSPATNSAILRYRDMWRPDTPSRRLRGRVCGARRSRGRSTRLRSTLEPGRAPQAYAAVRARLPAPATHAMSGRAAPTATARPVRLVRLPPGSVPRACKKVNGAVDWP